MNFGKNIDEFVTTLPVEHIETIAQIAEKTGFDVQYLNNWAYGIYSKISDDKEESHVRKTINQLIESTKNIYKSVEDIPTHRSDVSPIEFDKLGIPEGNFITQFFRFVSGITDTYPEYIVQSALSALSTVCQRRLYVALNGNRYYPNLWLGNAGSSGYARKSAAIREAKKVVKASCGNLYLSSDLNPASMIDNMATVIKNKKKDKEGNVTWESETLSVCDEVHNDIIRSRRTYIKDEFGQLLRELQKSTHSQFKETFLLLHSCDTYDKDLIAKNVLIEDPYFSMYWSTTANTIKTLLTKSDIASGWLARTLYVEPSYTKQRKDAEDSDDEDEIIANSRIELEHMLDMINKTLKNTVNKIVVDDTGAEKLEENAIRVRFATGVLEMMNTWVAEREEYYASTNDELLGAYVARFQENSVRLAMLIELGNLPDLLSEKSANIITEFRITKSSMETSLKLIDSMYMPYAIKLSTELKEDNASTAQSGVSNAMRMIERQLSNNLKMPARTCQRNCSMNKIPFDDVVDSLIGIGAVERVRVRTDANKLIDWLVYYPPEFRYIPFCNTYSECVVSRYETGIKLDSFKPKVSKIIAQFVDNTTDVTKPDAFLDNPENQNQDWGN